MRTYYHDLGGLPSQSETPDPRAVFTTAYAFLPANTMRDIVTSYLPGWEQTRFWIIARPLSGFAETFSHYIGDIAPGGGSDAPDPTQGVEAILFVAHGNGTLTLDKRDHDLRPGAYVYVAPGTAWRLHNSGTEKLVFHWIRKRYEPAPSVTMPVSFVTHDDKVEPIPMPDTNGVWATSRFVDPSDLTHDMHLNIVTFQPGGVIPFPETHVMEHGIYVLQGRASYLLNQDWVEVGPGDYMWLRAFCPQACKAYGDEPFRYLLYKDVNRHPKLGSFLA